MPPKGKRAGRPIKKFPNISDEPNRAQDGQSVDLNTLANAAQSVDFNFEQAWPKLDQASERLAHLRTLQTDRGLSKENQEQLTNAINSFHVLLVAPSSILDNTPDLYKDEFKNRATALTAEYLQFCLDVSPKKDQPEKDQYLQMLLEKLIKPIREQPSLWGPHSLQITSSVANWEELRKTVPQPGIPYPHSASGGSNDRTNFGPPPIAPSYSSSEHPHQYPPSQFHSMPPHHGYAPHPYYQPNHIVPQGYPYTSNGEYPHPSNYSPPNVFESLQPYSTPHPGQYQNRTSEQHGLPPSTPAYPQYMPAPNQMPSPIQTHRPTPMTSNPPARDGGTPYVGPPQDVDTPLQTSNGAHPVSPRLHRPKPVNLTTPSRKNRFSRPPPSRQVHEPVNPMVNIRRHPSYAPEMQEIHGEIPETAQLEKDHGNPVDPLHVLRTPPKRPISVGSNEDLAFKRKRTDNGMERIQMNRPLSREEIRYQAAAKEHEEDERFLANKGQTTVDSVPTTPVLVDDGVPLSRRPMRRSMSRSDIAVVEHLTPAIRELMSPTLREDSPDRERWETKGAIPREQEIVPRSYDIPSHIRSVNAAGGSQVALLPPGGNALGARSPEYGRELSTRPLEHSRPRELFDAKPHLHRQILPIPTSASEMPRIMSIHDGINQERHVEAREFYIHKRTVTIAKSNEWTKPCRDGTIRLGRYFSLTQEEVDETKEYLRFITGHETIRPKTMIRLTCRPRNGGQLGMNNHAWPENAIVFLNGKCLLTSMHTPLYIAPEKLSTINQIRIKVHPNTVQGYFSVNLEVFSLLSYSEMKTFILFNSPNTDQALSMLKGIPDFKHESNGFVKAQISLLCGGSDHVMTFPVYGKNCVHIERLDLSCFVEKISVGPDFEWLCPYCPMRCMDDIPLFVDKLILGIIMSHKPNSKKEMFQITSDGQICDDSASETESESESEDEQKFEDESP